MACIVIDTERPNERSVKCWRLSKNVAIGTPMRPPDTTAAFCDRLVQQLGWGVPTGGSHLERRRASQVELFSASQQEVDCEKQREKRQGKDPGGKKGHTPTIPFHFSSSEILFIRFRKTEQFFTGAAGDV